MATTRYTKCILILIFSIFFLKSNTYSKYYKYRDENGILHFTDNLSEVPDKLLKKTIEQKETLDYLTQEKKIARKKALDKAIKEQRKIFIETFNKQYTNDDKHEKNDHRTQTKIEVVNDRIIVPVTLCYSTKKVHTKLLLDTGATGVLINSSVAERLGIEDTQTGRARVADGSIVLIKYCRIEYIMVGPKVSRYPRISIINNKGPQDKTEGLLGMSFLKQFPHTLDLNNKLIKWQY